MISQDSAGQDSQGCDWSALRSHLRRWKEADQLDGTIIVPVNAAEDLQRVTKILSDLGRYRGKNSFEVILVINNYLPHEPPSITNMTGSGLRILLIPDVRKPGEHPALSARMDGINAAKTNQIMLFDADCRIPHPTALFDWYVKKLQAGYSLAYTHVGYWDLSKTFSVRFRILVHHLLRLLKRTILGIPTSRGSNYAVEKNTMESLYQQGLISRDIHVGPAIKSITEKIAYSGKKEHTVLTSGRKIKKGWNRLLRYWRWRLDQNQILFQILANESMSGYHGEQETVHQEKKTTG